MREKPLILIVDDEHNFLEIFSKKLIASGFEAITARNGKDAVRIAIEKMPDLVLMDIHMPNETGTDVALEIKQNSKTKEIKIAFLTNLKEPWPGVAGARETIAKELGMEDFLEKTDDLNNLIARIKNILGMEAPPQSPPPAPAQ